MTVPKAMPSSATGRKPSWRFLPIGPVLAALTALLVLGATVGISVIAAVLLRRLAEEQAIAHTALAVRSAREMVERTEDGLLASARILAERPTLDRLVGARQSAELEAFIARFCAPAGHSTCAVVRGDTMLVVAPAGAAVAAPYTDGVRAVGDGTTVSIVAGVTVPGHPDVRAIVVRDIDQAFTDAIAAHIGLSVRVHGPAIAASETGAPRDGSTFRASLPLSGRRPDDGLRIEVGLAANHLDRSVRTLLVILLSGAAAIVAVAAAGAWLIGGVVGRPLTLLAASARRIGAGDLATPIRPAPGREAAHLAATMDEMRRRLLGLTGELRRSQADAQALLDGIVEGVFSVDQERRIRYLNPQAAGLLGIDADQAVGRFCGDVLRPAPLGDGRPCDGRCPIVHARSRGSTRATEVIQLAGGRRRVVVITSSEPADGRQVQVLRDETEIEGARRARDAIVANISHEFRTPLSAQIASLELLREHIDPGNGGAELVRSLERGSLRLGQLVDNLLESVRLESGEDAIRRRPVAIDEVVEEAVELMSPLAQQRDQSIDVALDHPLPTIHGDPQRLIHVLVNLLANASKFAPEGTAIRLHVGHDGGSRGVVTLAITDQGPGLPPGEESLIFNRFYRPGEAEAGGMGLGLWIVKSIVERHGGTVRAASPAAGGACFTVVLPVSGS